MSKALKDRGGKQLLVALEESHLETIKIIIESGKAKSQTAAIHFALDNLEPDTLLAD